MFSVLKFVNHGPRVLNLAESYGWRPGVRYTHLRDIKNISFAGRGFLDICWRNYCFERHFAAVQTHRPYLTVARDVTDIRMLEQVLEEATQLSLLVRHVIIVPKDKELAKRLDTHIPANFMLGYSCPTRYGKTEIPPERFTRPVHILGGRPDIQRKVADLMPVYSFDCNRFTLDAAFGDFFDGQRFRPLGSHNYEKCLELSLAGINHLWEGYA